MVASREWIGLTALDNGENKRIVSTTLTRSLADQKGGAGCIAGGRPFALAPPSSIGNGLGNLSPDNGGRVSSPS
jgi:hypothetical protein